jgi:hypothetical protein
MRQLCVALAAPFLAGAFLAPTPAADTRGGGLVQLFNGKDLSGWDTWLGRPYKGKEPVGLNRDPDGVFKVVQADGKPAIRISGQTFGALTSQKEYGNYHLRLEFKWGDKKWPPRAKEVRDSGLLYHCVGSHGAGGSYWMRSLELQIEEHDCGDFWSVDGVLVDVRAVPQSGIPGAGLVYNKDGKPYTVPREVAATAGRTRVDPRIIKDGDYERPVGQWNTIELYTVGGTSVHVVNGKAVMVLTGARQPVKGGKTLPLTRGKIQLQSEGAEVFYRNIALRPLDRIPEELLK